MNAVNMNKSITSQGGFSLLELMIVVSVIGMLAAGAYALAPGLMSSVGSTNEIKKVEAISQRILSVYDKASNFSGLDDAVAMNLSVFPEDMVDGSNVYNRWNGEVTIAVANDLQGNANRAFTVTSDEVPVDACSEMATGQAGAARVQVGAAGSTGGTTTYLKDTGVNMSSVSTACASGPVSITYLYEKR